MTTPDPAAIARGLKFNFIDALFIGVTLGVGLADTVHAALYLLGVVHAWR